MDDASGYWLAALRILRLLWNLLRPLFGRRRPRPTTRYTRVRARVGKWFRWERETFERRR